MSAIDARSRWPNAPVPHAAQPDLPPPASTIGIVGWLRRNLFSGWINSLFTVATLAVLWLVVPPLFGWTVLDAHVEGTDRSACTPNVQLVADEVRLPVRLADGSTVEAPVGVYRAVVPEGVTPNVRIVRTETRKLVTLDDGRRGQATVEEDDLKNGACWTFVKVRLPQFIYGFYPEDQRWRPTLVVLLGLGALVWALADRLPGRRWVALFLCVPFPILAFVLLSGGIFGLPHVETGKWGGLLLTLVIASTGIAASLPIGIALALGRRSHMPVIRSLSVIFIEFVRAVPLITVLFMASVILPLFLPPGSNFDQLLRALIGVALFASAYMAEVVRGGLQAVPKGQYEAAQAMGLGYWQMMRLVVMPQALRVVIPAIVSTFIGLFKDTTLVLIIGLTDLLAMVQLAITDAKWLGLATEGYAFAGAVFFVFCYGMSKYSQYLEGRLATGYRR